MTQILCNINPRALILHPAHDAIYGDDADENMISSVAAHDIIQPIIVSADGKTILSGSRRWRAAISAYHTTVPIIIRQDLTDPDEILTVVIESNRQRVKSTEMLMKEIETLTGIMERQQKLSKKDVVKKVASTTGTSPRTVSKAITASKAVKTSENKGQTEKAAKIKEATSVSKAYKTSQECPRGGQHEWKEGACEKCCEPQPKGAKRTAAAPSAKGSIKAAHKDAAVAGLFQTTTTLFASLTRTLDELQEKLGPSSRPKRAACERAMEQLHDAIQTWAKIVT